MIERQIVGVKKKKKNGRKKCTIMWQGNSVKRDETSQTEQQATHDPLVGRKRNENRECGELVVCCWSLSLMPSVKLVIEIVQKFKFCKTFDCVPVTKSKLICLSWMSRTLDQMSLQ